MGLTRWAVFVFKRFCGRAPRYGPARRGSSSGLRFNDEQAESMFGGNISMLEKYSSTIKATLRRGEAQLLLTSAEQIFGAPSQEILDKVRSAKSKKLVEWAVRMRTAQSWTELIAD